MANSLILVIEDDTVMQGLITALLSGDYEIITAGSGEEGLKKISTRIPDLILLDIGLPDMDGTDVCRKLKTMDERTAAVPVIFLTSHASSADEVEGFKAGGMDYVTKPIKPEVLRARIRNQLELKRSRDALEQMARLDGLTGLPNRRTFDAAASREWRRQGRTGEPLSVILMDIDHFKQFNDTYGHGEGDTCLKKVAEAAAGALQRPADMLARYGGEEFVALLPDTTLDGALGVAESIRAAVALLSIPHIKSSAASHVTLSLGAATMVPDADKSIDMLLKAADEQLYAAKNAGRNKSMGINLASPGR